MHGLSLNSSTYTYTQFVKYACSCVQYTCGMRILVTFMCAHLSNGCRSFTNKTDSLQRYIAISYHTISNNHAYTPARDSKNFTNRGPAHDVYLLLG